MKSPLPSPSDHAAIVRPLRSDAARNERLVLEAARLVFAERGAAAGFDEIARRAGVGVGTVYRRFPDRDALFTALFEDRFLALGKLASDFDGAQDVSAAFETFVIESVRMYTEDRGLREFTFGATEQRPAVIEARRRLRPLIDRVVARAHAASAVRSDLRPDDLANVIAMVSAVQDRSAFDEEHVGSNARLRCARFVLDGIGPKPGRA